MADDDSTLYEGQTDDVSDSDVTLHAGHVMQAPVPSKTDPVTPTSVDALKPSITEPTPREVEVWQDVSTPAGGSYSTTDQIRQRRRSPAVDESKIARDESSNPTNSGIERTYHAMAAMELSTLFSHSFALDTFGISPRYRVRMTQTDGQSTRGGTLARQSILLYVEGNERQNVVIGFVESARNRAELRSHAVMDEIFEERFRRRFDMVESEYNKLLDRIRAFADTQGIAVRTQEEMSRSESVSYKPAEPAAPGIQLKQGILLLIGVLLIGVGIGYVLAG